MGTKRFKLTLAYDGAPFAGWQRQPERETVQVALERALSATAKTPIALHGSGRTDAGVHARGQVAHFDVPSDLSLSAQNWTLALNGRLPPSVRVLHCETVSDSFHARFSARQKTYCYSIDTTPILWPLRHGRVWHVPQQLDRELFEQAVAQYLGTHRFDRFCALRGNETDQTDYTRTLSASFLTQSRYGFVYTVRAEGFLYKMVRILTGVAVQVALGRLSLNDLEMMLSASISVERDFNRTKFCAPAAGLRLEEVDYG